MNPVERQDDDSLKIYLPHAEGLVLCSLPQRIEDLLSQGDFNQRVADRLFPVAYEDADKEAEYRKLLGDDLKKRKLESVKAFKETIENWEITQSGVEVTIEAELVETWLGFLNDMRLYLAIELDITENDWSAGLEPDEEMSEELALLHLLTWLQQCILDALGFVQERYIPEGEEPDGREAEET